jgi:hypothetical protein
MLAQSRKSAWVVALGILAGVQQAWAYPNLSNSDTPDLTLVVWDTTLSKTYFRDLGQTWQAKNGNGQLPTDAFNGSLGSFAPDANWARFLAALGGSPTSTTFYDVVSGTRASSTALVATGGAAFSAATGTYSGEPNGSLTAVTLSQLRSAIDQWQSFAVANAGTGAGSPNFNTASGAGVTSNVHGSNLSVLGDPGEASAANWQNGFGQANFTTFANVGTRMNFFEMYGTGGLGKQRVDQLPVQWLLTADGVLTVSAVPEPQAWLLLAAGTLLVGFVTRRRLNTI